MTTIKRLLTPLNHKTYKRKVLHHQTIKKLKNLIVPTNFSANADQVLHYAIKLANQLGSNIHLVHVLDKGSFMDKPLSKREAAKKLEQTAALFEREVFFTTFIKTTLLEGSVINQLCSFSRKIGADLIVMGGAESWRRTGLNKNITDIIRKSRTSVFVVPNGYEYQPIECLTLSINRKISSSDPEMLPFISLVEKINGKVKILEAAKTRVLSCVEIGEKHKTDAFAFKTFSIAHDSINRGIQNFISNSNTNVLCFINREYGLSGRFLNNLATRTETNDKLIPLLLLHEKMERYSISRNLN